MTLHAAVLELHVLQASLDRLVAEVRAVVELADRRAEREAGR